MRYVVLLLPLLLMGCELWGPDLDDPVAALVKPPYNGVLNVALGGQVYEVFVFAQPSGYDAGEVVLWGSANGWDRTLQLTFAVQPVPTGTINTELTGYWDLGLCTPMRRYVPTSATPSRVDITTYDPETGLLEGRFTLHVRNEDDPGDTLTFTRGTFSVQLGSTPFTYCIEG